MTNPPQPDWTLRILEAPDEMQAVEDLQRIVWPGSETEIIPAHLLITAAQNGGLVIGAFAGASAAYQGAFSPTPPAPANLIGFTFGFIGSYSTPAGLRFKHCSHMLAIHPGFRSHGLGFALKRAQWQIVRNQGLDCITWTYDPLLSINANLNITHLGAVCNLYRRDEYGPMRDALNAGLPSDRFQVNWWVNSARVGRRLSRRRRLVLDLAHFLAAGAQIINPSQDGISTWPRPAPALLPDWVVEPPPGAAEEEVPAEIANPLLLVEIPADFQALRAADPALALEWRLHSRQIFEDLFTRGYIVTDFVYLPGAHARSFYVLTHGESTL